MCGRGARQPRGAGITVGLILDSTVLIAAERKLFELAAFLESEAPTEPVFTTVVTASELWHGVERAEHEARRVKRRAFVEAVIEATPVLSFDLACARQHAQLWARLENKGERIGAHGMLIAAICLQFGHRLATLNTAEFRRVEGLELVETRGFVRGEI